MNLEKLIAHLFKRLGDRDVSISGVGFDSCTLVYSDEVGKVPDCKVMIQSSFHQCSVSCKQQPWSYLILYVSKSG